MIYGGPIRVVKVARANYVAIPRKVLEALCWKRGDMVMAYTDGLSLTFRRVKLEQILESGARSKA